MQVIGPNCIKTDISTYFHCKNNIIVEIELNGTEYSILENKIFSDQGTLRQKIKDGEKIKNLDFSNCRVKYIEHDGLTNRDLIKLNIKNSSLQGSKIRSSIDNDKLKIRPNIDSAEEVKLYLERYPDNERILLKVEEKKKRYI